MAVHTLKQINSESRIDRNKRKAIAYALARIDAFDENLTRDNLTREDQRMHLGWIRREIEQALHGDFDPFQSSGGLSCGCHDNFAPPDPACKTCGGTGLITLRAIAERVGLYGLTPDPDRPCENRSFLGLGDLDGLRFVGEECGKCESCKARGVLADHAGEGI